MLCGTDNILQNIVMGLIFCYVEGNHNTKNMICHGQLGGGTRRGKYTMASPRLYASRFILYFTLLRVYLNS